MGSESRNINFVTLNSKRKFHISMKNYHVDMKTGSVKTDTLQSEFIREIYEMVDPLVGLAKYTLESTEYMAAGKEKFQNWTFAKGAEFYNMLYNIDLAKYYKVMDECGVSKKKFYPTLKECFDKYPKLPSVYLLIMQVLDIIMFDSYLCLINTHLRDSNITKEYTRLEELSRKHTGIGAGQYSENSYYYNEDFYVRLIGNGLYQEKECWIYDYYAEPSRVFMKDVKSGKTKNSKSIYSGRVYISKEDGECICGEMNENVVPIGTNSNFVSRRVVLEMEE